MMTFFLAERRVGEVERAVGLVDEEREAVRAGLTVLPDVHAAVAALGRCPWDTGGGAVDAQRPTRSTT
jgi:hypothetical protein